MTDGIMLALWIGIIALLVLIVCFISYRRLHNKHEHKAVTKCEETRTGKEKPDDTKKEKTYTSNERLDGARVSHRRTHPDRLQEAKEWQEKKELEICELQKKIELERKNKLFMIFSPCNADVSAIYENSQEAQRDGYAYPGMIMAPSDDKIYAPINGTLYWNNEQGNEIIMKSNTGIVVTIRCRERNEESKHKMNYFTLHVKEGGSIAMGEMIAKFQNGIIKKNNKSVLVQLEMTEYFEDRLLLIKRTNYVSHGDKVITIRLQE